MKTTVDLKSRKSVMKGVVTGLVCLFATSLLWTGCGAGKASLSATPGETYRLDESCALIHVYRPASMMGRAMSYHLNLDDEAVFRVKNKSKTTVRVTSEGKKTLWAKTETREELPIEIELGKEYYVRCGVRMGALVGRPRVELVDGETGKREFDGIK
ncbi:MAG: hypothetical protein LBP25_03375 [Tannerellaceae bacterium]|jgi:hypothetical protein|nr:hypothetical protein [Tannerellaceae bacterium]